MTPLQSTDHACEVHGGALLHVDSLAAEDLCDGLGDGEVDDVAHDGGGADLALVQPAVRLLATALSLELETNLREVFTIWVKVPTSAFTFKTLCLLPMLNGS